MISEDGGTSRNAAEEPADRRGFEPGRSVRNNSQQVSWQVDSLSKRKSVQR